MSNGYNAYSIASGLVDSTENIWQAEQARKMQEFELAQQKGELESEFKEDIISSQRERERILQQQKKGSFFDKVLPLAGMFAGPVGSAVIGGLHGMYKTKEQSKHALAQIDKAGDAGIDMEKWGNIYLGNQARDIKGARDLQLDSLKRDAQVSGMDLLGTGLAGGMSGYAMGKIGEGVKEAFGPLKEMGGGDLLDLAGSGQIDITDIVGGGKAPGGFIEKLMEGLGGTDLSTMIGEDKMPQFQNLLMILKQMQGDT